MAGKSGPDAATIRSPKPRTGVYIDSSALAKLYLPETESEQIDNFLQGRRDLMISELSLTEVTSAVARRKREGILTAGQANQIRDALMADAQSGSFHRLDITPSIHREAERMLLTTDSIALRTLDALHIALALSGPAQLLITFDLRMADAAVLFGLSMVRL